MEIRVRIAPSPTGKLHIGTARTALFNYLFAKKNKGRFFLRFEDTDQERSTKEFEQEIEEGLKWLGLDWDGDIVYQMDRLDIYSELALKLQSEGYVYKKEGALWFDVKRAMADFNITGKEVEARREDKVIKSTLIELPEPDLIQGKISGNVEDFVIMRSNGVPTFHFAVVVDDNASDITHVIRGVDHFANTPKHYLLYLALGYEAPRWAHIPLTLNPDRTKLSKRRGAVSVSDFEKEGYLPESLINFIALLGWHPGGGEERELFSLAELAEAFSIEKMSKSNAIFDQDKLDNINGIYIRQKSALELFVKMQGIVELPKVDKDYLLKVIEITKERMKRLTDFTELSKYFFEEPVYDSKILIFKKSDKEKSAKGLELAVEILKKLEEWPEAKDEFKDILKNAMEKNGLSFGDMFWPVRVALSGREQSPGPDELLWALSRGDALTRLEKAVSLLK